MAHIAAMIHMHPGIRTAILVCLLLALAILPADAETNRAEQLIAYMQTAAGSLGVQQVEMLAQINDSDKRHLAMTYYLRAGKTISSRWSWTNEQIKHYEKSAEFSAALTEIKRIAIAFSAANPRHVVFANTEVRSLEEQVRRWQIVRSIDVAAGQLRSAALRELAKDSYVANPDDASSKRFRDFLIAWRASPAPTLAAPGLSLHGRGRAFDFQILDLNGRTVAGTDTATIRANWDNPGWTKKLANAVHTTSKNFVGPLAAPREPWHYEYRPGAE
jgi:hypothetical protein